MSDEEQNLGGVSNSGVPESRAGGRKSVFSDDFDDPDRRDELDELPDDEPLTAELVEEEAIRGDFMLRWAVVLLSVLMAFTQMSDTRPLVLIKSGEYMRSHGFLPPRTTDPLSFTMDGRSITNTGWLFDHVVSLAWSLGGYYGLTALKVLGSGLFAFLLTRISIPGLPTWWSSVCAAFAVVACSQDFVPTHELAGLVLLAYLLNLLTGHRLGRVDGLYWKLPALLALWSNLDPRAWIGAVVVLLYALGSARHRRALLRQGAGLDRIPMPLGATAGLCFAALLVNPFPVASLAAPLTQYTREYPAMQLQKSLVPELAASSFDNRVDYYSAILPGAVRLFDHTHVAAIVVLMFAGAALSLSVGSEQSDSARRGTIATAIGGFLRLLLLPILGTGPRGARDAGFVLMFWGFVFLIVLKAHELPAAALVAAAVAGISAQDWYRRSFSMTYTVDSSELLFSRGGRAATVLAMTAMGFAVATSRLPGSAPLGFGFDPETRITIDTVSQQLQKLDPEARVLHTRVDQGDLLIWNGRRSFLDSRVLPFSSAQYPVFEQHDNVRRSLLRPPQSTESADPKEKERLQQDQQKNIAAAKETLTQYGVTHFMIRLAPPGTPDYESMLTLTSSGEFVPVSIEASAALLEKVSGQAAPETVAAKMPNFVQMAFVDAKQDMKEVRIFARPQGFYERYIYRNRPVMSAERRQAQHYMALANPNPGGLQEAANGIALLTLAIRGLNQSLQANPNETAAWIMLGQAYVRLGNLEVLVSGTDPSPRLRQTRYFQAVAAFRQAVKTNSGSIQAWEGLMNSYQLMQRQDLLLESLDKWLELAETSTVLPSQQERFEEFRTQCYAQRRELEDLITESDAQLDKEIEQQIAANAEAMKQQAAAAGGKDQALDPTLADAEEAREFIMSAAAANRGGRPRRALNVLQENAAMIRKLPMGVVLLGQLLLETGEMEEAYLLLLGISEQASKQPEIFFGTEWQLPLAISQLGVCDYRTAAETWSVQMADIEREISKSAVYSLPIYSLPLVADSNYQINGALPVWPFRHATLLAQQISGSNEPLSDLALMQAIVKLEAADLEGARSILKRIVTEFGETRARGLALVYYSMVDRESQQVLEPMALNPWEEFEFPGEPRPPAQPAAGAPGAPGAPAGVPGGIPGLPAGSNPGAVPSQPGPIGVRP